MTMEITFPGGVAVDASLRGFTINTDQPEGVGGADSAPTPFDIFLASIGTCAGFFTLRFCQQRKIDPAGMKLSLETIRGTGQRKLDKVSLTIHLPDRFPEKYREAIIKATDMCAVKQTILDPPDFETTVV